MTLQARERSPSRSRSPAAPLAPPSDGVVRAAEAIRSMEVRGAGKIARTAAMALADYAHRVRGDGGRPTAAGLYRDLERAARLLVATRPTAVSLRIAVNLVLAPARQCVHADGNADDVRRCAYEAGTRFAHESAVAVERAAERAAAWLPERGAVLTHCNSQAAIETLAIARRLGRRVRAVCTESRPWFQGHLTARQLREAGVPTTFVVDSAAYEAMRSEGVEAVVVGADTVTAAGTLVNKVGTCAVALAAKELRIPVYVAAESYKFSPFATRGDQVPLEERDAEEVLAPAPAAFRDLDVRVRNPVFDATPGRLVRRFATEHRALAPRQCRDYVTRTFGDVREWI